MGWINKTITLVLLALLVNSQVPVIQERLGDYGTLNVKVVDAHVDDDVLNIDLDVSLKNTKDFDYDVENCMVNIYWDAEHTNLADGVNIGDTCIEAGGTWSDTVSLTLVGYDGQSKIYIVIDAVINGFSYHAEQSVRIGV